MRQRIDVVMKMWALSPTRRSVLHLLGAVLAAPLALPVATRARASSAVRPLTRGGKGKGKKGKGKKKKKEEECNGDAAQYTYIMDGVCLSAYFLNIIQATDCAICFDECAPMCGSCSPWARSECEARCRQTYPVDTGVQVPCN